MKIAGGPAFVVRQIDNAGGFAGFEGFLELGDGCAFGFDFGVSRVFEELFQAG